MGKFEMLTTVITRFIVGESCVDRSNEILKKKKNHISYHIMSQNLKRFKSFKAHWILDKVCGCTIENYINTLHLTFK